MVLFIVSKSIYYSSQFPRSFTKEVKKLVFKKNITRVNYKRCVRLIIVSSLSYEHNLRTCLRCVTVILLTVLKNISNVIYVAFISLLAIINRYMVYLLQLVLMISLLIIHIVGAANMLSQHFSFIYITIVLCPRSLVLFVHSTTCLKMPTLLSKTSTTV